MEIKSEENKEVSISGYFGKERKFNYKFFEESNKSAINTKIYREGKDGNVQSISIKAFNANAERLKNAIEKEGIKKITVTGKFKEVNYTNTKGEAVTSQELQISKLAKHKVMEIQGNIARVEHKSTSKNKKFTDLLVINDRVDESGQTTKEFYTVTVWDEKKKGIPTDVKLEKGALVAIKGEATILENQEGTKQYTSIDAWNIDQNLKKLEEQIASKQLNKETKLDYQASITLFEKDSGNLPSGVSESIEYKIYKNNNQGFATQGVYHDADFKSTSTKLIQHKTVDELKKYLEGNISFDDNNVSISTGAGKEEKSLKNLKSLNAEVDKLFPQKIIKDTEISI